MVQPVEHTALCPQTGVRTRAGGCSGAARWRSRRARSGSAADRHRIRGAVLRSTRQGECHGEYCDANKRSSRHSVFFGSFGSRGAGKRGASYPLLPHHRQYAMTKKAPSKARGLLVISRSASTGFRPPFSRGRLLSSWRRLFRGTLPRGCSGAARRLRGRSRLLRRSSLWCGPFGRHLYQFLGPGRLHRLSSLAGRGGRRANLLSGFCRFERLRLLENQFPWCDRRCCRRNCGNRRRRIRAALRTAALSR